MIVDIIAVRELELLHPDGLKTPVTVKIGRPEPFPGGGGFFCPFEISGLAKPENFRGGGADEMQALVLTLKMIGNTLVHSPEGKAGLLRWFGESDLGFPL